MKKVSSFGILKEIWGNRKQIKEWLAIIQIVIEHVRNLIEDLTDDGKLNGSNKKAVK